MRDGKRPNQAAQDAAYLLIELREKAGLARKDVPRAMRSAGIQPGRIPSVKTLWRIEELAHEPNIGLKAGLAEFYGRDLHQIWPPRKPLFARQGR